MSTNDVQSAGPRPDGMAGLLIDEIELTAITRTPRGYVATARTPDRKAYVLRAGDQLFDGDVIIIQAREVIFKQIVQDPTASKPFREVVKTLKS